MKNTKFTEGDWFVDYEPCDQTATIQIKCGELELMSVTPWFDCNPEFYAADANAILMSKSPKMYKMLDEILSLINSSRNEIELADAVDQLGGEIQGLLAEARGDKND